MVELPTEASSIERAYSSEFLEPTTSSTKLKKVKIEQFVFWFHFCGVRVRTGNETFLTKYVLIA